MKVVDIPLGATDKVTVERRGQIVLIGINRPYIQNRVDPKHTSAWRRRITSTRTHVAACGGALRTRRQFLPGHRVDGFQALAASGQPSTDAETIDPLPKAKGLSKPLVVVVHGDSANMGHELHLVADIRIAAANTRFGQDENTHGRFPGGSAPRSVSYVKPDGLTQCVHADRRPLERARSVAHGRGADDRPDGRRGSARSGIDTATKIAACGPLGIKATLASAHLAIDSSEAEALSKMEAQYRALYSSEDFKEGRKAEAEGRPPIYQGR